MSLASLWNTTARRRVWGVCARLVNGDEHVSFGSNFRCDGLPNIWHTARGRVEIGQNVYFRSGVEIRAHRNAQVLIGDNVRIDRDVRILASENAVVIIGNDSSIGKGTVLNAKDSITLGAKVLVSGYVFLQTSMHKYDRPGPVKDQGFDYGPVDIGDGAWLGAHAVVMPGVSMGAGSILGANGVLTKSTPPDTIYAGIPAKLLKTRLGE